MTPADLFSLLLGRWHLTRTIPNHATMHGEATVTPDGPSRALYTEAVQLHTAAGAHLTGTARYTFTRLDHTTLDVHLHTGALFHTLHFTSQPNGTFLAQAHHLCVDDRYSSTYTLHSPGRLTIEHHVRGPHKLYTSTTILTRP